MDTWGAVVEAESALGRQSGAVTINREVLLALVDAVKGSSSQFSLSQSTLPRQVEIEREHVRGDVMHRARIVLDDPQDADLDRFVTLFSGDGAA